MTVSFPCIWMVDRSLARLVVRWAWILGLLGTGSAPAATGSRAAAKPNVVVILADDLGWGDLRRNEPRSRIPTPHLDRLAAEGLRFTDAHSPSSVCSPTRYGLLTGRYAWRTRLKSGVLWGYSPPLIEPGRATLASFLRDEGYATACVGKWHLGLGWATRSPVEFGDRSTPAADPGLVDYGRPLSAGPHTVGFDYSFILPASLDMDPYVFVENGRATAVPDRRLPASRHQRQGGAGFWREGPAAPDFTPESCQPVLLQRAEAFLRRQSPDRPFFLYFPLTSPHDPWVPQAEFRGRTGLGDRADFVVQVDATVGRLMQVLQETGLERDTLLLFTSDNGAHWLPEEVARTGHPANGPWRGQKADAWEGGHRVPLLARWPGRVKAGTTSDALVCLVDLLATCAEIVGRPVPAGAEDSRSFLGVLEGRRRRARESLVLHSINGVFAYREGDWKWIDAPGSGGWSAGRGTETNQLYQLRQDPAESRNRATTEPRRVARMRAALQRVRGEGTR